MLICSMCRFWSEQNYDLCNLNIFVLNGVELYMTREIINVVASI